MLLKSISELLLYVLLCSKEEGKQGGRKRIMSEKRGKEILGKDRKGGKGRVEWRREKIGSGKKDRRGKGEETKIEDKEVERNKESGDERRGRKGGKEREKEEERRGGKDAGLKRGREERRRAEEERKQGYRIGEYR